MAWGLSGSALALLAALLHWPVLATPLALAPLPAAAWGMALACSLACVLGVTLLTRWISIIRS